MTYHRIDEADWLVAIEAHGWVASCRRRPAGAQVRRRAARRMGRQRRGARDRQAQGPARAGHDLGSFVRLERADKWRQDEAAEARLRQSAQAHPTARKTRHESRLDPRRRPPRRARRAGAVPGLRRRPRRRRRAQRRPGRPVVRRRSPQHAVPAITKPRTLRLVETAAGRRCRRCGGLLLEDIGATSSVRSRPWGHACGASRGRRRTRVCCDLLRGHRP